MFNLVQIVEIDNIHVSCIVQSTLQIEKVIMFTGMCTLQILVLSNLSKLTICSCILFICLSLTFFFISMAAKDMYSVWFHWTPSLDLSSARVFQVWLSRSHDQGLHRTIFFKMAPLFSLWHARTQQKGNGFLCKFIWNCFFCWKKIYKVWQFFS